MDAVSVWQVKHSGFLLKRRDVMQTWHWRYVTISGNVLTSYVDETEDKKTGELKLNKDCIVQVITDSTIDCQYAFEVIQGYECNDSNGDSNHDIDAIELSDNFEDNSGTVHTAANNIITSAMSYTVKTKKNRPSFVLCASDNNDLELWMLSLIQSINGEYTPDENFERGSVYIMPPPPPVTTTTTATGASTATATAINYQLSNEHSPIKDVSITSSAVDDGRCASSLLDDGTTISSPDSKSIDRRRSDRYIKRFSLKNIMQDDYTSQAAPALIAAAPPPPPPVVAAAVPVLPTISGYLMICSRVVRSWKTYGIEMQGNRLSVYESVDDRIIPLIPLAKAAIDMTTSTILKLTRSSTTTTTTSSDDTTAAATTGPSFQLKAFDATVDRKLKLNLYIDKNTSLTLLPVDYCGHMHAFSIRFNTDGVKICRDAGISTEVSAPFECIRFHTHTIGDYDSWTDVIRAEIDRQTNLHYVHRWKRRASILQSYDESSLSEDGSSSTLTSMQDAMMTPVATVSKSINYFMSIIAQRPQSLDSNDVTSSATTAGTSTGTNTGAISYNGGLQHQCSSTTGNAYDSNTANKSSTTTTATATTTATTVTTTTMSRLLSPFNFNRSKGVTSSYISSSSSSSSSDRSDTSASYIGRMHQRYFIHHVTDIIGSKPNEYIYMHVFENQKYLPLKGYSCSNLSYSTGDRFKLTDATGVKFPYSFLGKVDAPYGYTWIDDNSTSSSMVHYVITPATTTTTTATTTTTGSDNDEPTMLPVGWVLDHEYTTAGIGGWSYHSSFASFDTSAGHAAPATNHFVRRRRWIRFARAN